MKLWQHEVQVTELIATMEKLGVKPNKNMKKLREALANYRVLKKTQGTRRLRRDLASKIKRLAAMCGYEINVGV